jgi:hypothetical protein
MTRPKALIATFTALLAMACSAGCGSAWTARMCASNASGNCRGVDIGQPHGYPVSSTFARVVPGGADAKVRVPQCPSGIGEVDVTVVDRDNLQVTVYCLTDSQPGPTTMTLPAATSRPVPAPTNGGN